MSMIPLRRRLLMKAFKLSDILLATFAFFVSTALSARAGPETLAVFVSRILATETSLLHLLTGLAFALVWHAAFSACGLYQSRRLSRRSTEVPDIVKATTIGTLCLIVVDWLFQFTFITPSEILLFWVISTSLTIVMRWVLRLGLEQMRLSGRNLRQLLIVGVNERTVAFAQEVAGRPELGYAVSGFVDDEWPGQQEFVERGFTPVAGLDDFTRSLTNRVVDEVVIGLPLSSFYHRTAEIIERCREQGILVRLLGTIFDVPTLGVRTDRFDEDLVLTVLPERNHWFASLTKRVLDVALATVVLVLTAPIMLGVALLIRVTSRGPVFFVQNRVGLNKRVFPLYKFRTMVVDAESRQKDIEHLNEVRGPAFKIADDPRVTPLGRILRRTSIDELPQLVNVIKGDMSLVGPRPLPQRDVGRFEENWQRRRFSVRPGLTCLWQVNGRSRVPFEKWMELDMEYIDEWSLFLDLKILAKTVPAVLRGSGAV